MDSSMAANPNGRRSNNFLHNSYMANPNGRDSKQA
jgi:hypothetical protein